VPIAVANRYARALADVVARQGNYREIQIELQAFAAALHSSPDLREVFETPAITPDGRQKVLGAVLARLGASPVTTNLLRTVAANYRMRYLDEILAAFARTVNDRLGVAEVQVFSASEIPEEARKELSARFQQVTRKQVEMEYHLQEDLVGGILAQIRSTVYDGSVRGHLDRIREKLIAQ
jgi:F-type H+-transporting ATPase subunit delta